MKKKKRPVRKRPPESEVFSNQPFRNLGVLVGKSAQAAVAVPVASIPASQSDDEIFREAMREVHEIRAFREIGVATRPSAGTVRRKKTRVEGREELECIVSGQQPIRLADTQEYVEWVNPRYNRDIIRDLHQGRFAVQDSIDLHGLIVSEAESALSDFLREARRRGFRCIKIIHGRGLGSPRGPVLKQAVTSLLSCRYRKHVIGFSTARRIDGGLGALYVLLA